MQYIRNLFLSFFCFFMISYADIYGSLSEEEWRYTYNFCMQNNVNACDYLIDNGLMSAQNCFGEQCNTIGLIYTLAGRFAEALPYFEKLCDSGNMASCGSLGDTYYFYLKDYFRAKHYYEMACKHKGSASCYSLGIMYGNGEGVRQDFHKEGKLYQQACSFHEPLGCYNLGVLYADKTDTKNFQSIAKEYFGKACDYGYQIGCDKYKALNELGIK